MLNAESHRRSVPPAVIILTAFNLVLGLFMLFLMIFKDLARIAQRGFVPIDYVILPLDMILTTGYLLAGGGLLMRQKWGYYTHLVMCVLTLLNLPFCCCFGFIYTILGIVVAMKPAVRAYFRLRPKEPAPVPDTAPRERRQDIEFPD